MKKIILLTTLLLLAVSSYAFNDVGETVKPYDNLSWTINAPIGHSEVGETSDIFTKTSEGKAVLIWYGNWT